MPHVSDIKLIRTDTTLDLSQKAEKGMLEEKSDMVTSCPRSEEVSLTGFERTGTRPLKRYQPTLTESSKKVTTDSNRDIFKGLG
ncbi:hypothetical protein Syun_019508 [Stephania yunnanensis]|uniref:Uncharacterized protein n=1 Tax=Stephania yunnanensis TaxID=152371 RepID=A0AAP0IWM2_9MAGN